jgi:hypothetical protein
LRPDRCQAGERNAHLGRRLLLRLSGILLHLGVVRLSIGDNLLQTQHVPAKSLLARQLLIIL